VLLRLSQPPQQPRSLNHLTRLETSFLTRTPLGTKQYVFRRHAYSMFVANTLQYHSPYYNETHVALREEIREWVEDKLMANVTEWDEAKSVPDEIFRDTIHR
jgi:hypothetical protein